MQDRPSPQQLLEAASRCLRIEILPRLSQREAYRLRVVLNALALVGREIDDAQDRRSVEERARLKSLLGEEGDKPVTELTADLCRGIERGVLDDDEALIEHLWLTTVDKIEVDQPGYAGYRKALELRQARDGG
jgi:hypothetical protein